jgi:hypothetical protein
MTTEIRLSDFKLTQLNGDKFELDGGAMCGVVHCTLVKEISFD